MKIASMTLAALAGMLLAAPAFAGTPDQCVDHTFTRWTNGQQYEQQIRAGATGQLEGITFYFWASSIPGGTVTVNVYENATSCLNGSETPSFTGTYTVNQTGTVLEHFMDMTSANINLNAGDTFVVEWINDPQNGGATFMVNGGGNYTEPSCALGFPRPDVGAFCTEMVGGGLDLTFSGTCPGVVDVDITGMTPGGTLAVVRGTGPGSTVIPVGACAGTVLDLAGPSLVTTVPDGNNDGMISASPTLGPAFCGTPIQVVDMATCTTSNVASP